jgi:uncharacterized membrane protein YiaA
MNQKTIKCIYCSVLTFLELNGRGFLKWTICLLLKRKGYYFTILMFGLFAVSLQKKSVRDRARKHSCYRSYYEFVGLLHMLF